MPDLKPTTALGAQTSRRARHGMLRLEENSGLALASLSLRRNGKEPSPFDLILPGPGKWVQHGPISALWTGQGQWLIEAVDRAETDFVVELAELCPSCSVTEQTDGFVAFEVYSDAGAAPIAALMQKLVNLDPSTFGQGSATRTGMEHMSVFVIRRAPERLAILGMRSAAETLWHVIETAIRRQVELSSATT
ncbi:sarcosine oxidase subunit gamma [Agrobacterium arsenijevicii]|uniref:Sarcosine oxidase subunit gamma n=1 Tax=Agrobacterium arsenijevicii TaxID=1585697 RepID=A0ABR5D743_9HYPH|nr:sarcosine oxidase subunit gamma [Agrobacterium arsenijevicii]